jgi:hypothetical protein
MQDYHSVALNRNSSLLPVHPLLKLVPAYACALVPLGDHTLVGINNYFLISFILNYIYNVIITFEVK